MLFTRACLLLFMGFATLGANNGIVVYEANIAKLIDKETEFDVADVKSMIIKVSIDEDVSDVLDKNDDVRAAQKLADAAQRSVKLTVKTVGTLFDEYEKRAKALQEKNEDEKAKQVFKDFEVQANKLIDKIEAKALQDMEKEWKAIQKSRSDYKKYKLNAGINLTVKITGLMVSVARVAVTAGADLSAIKSGISDIYGIYKDIKKLADTAEKVHKQNVKTLAALQKSLLKKDPKSLKEKAKDKAQKAMVALMHGGVKDLSKSNDLFENKLRGLDVRADEIGKKINILLNKVESQKKDLSDKQLEAIATLQKDHFAKIDNLNERLGQGLANALDMKKSIKDLEDVTPTGKFSKIEALYDQYAEQLSLLVTVAGQVDNVLGMVSSDYAAASSTAKSALKVF